MPIPRSFLDDQISQLLEPLALDGNFTLNINNFYSLNQLTGQSAQTVTIPADLARSEFRIGGMAAFFTSSDLIHKFSPAAGVTLNGQASDIDLPSGGLAGGIITLTRTADNAYLLQLGATSGGGGGFLGALAYKSNGTQSITSGVQTILDYTNEEYDTSSFHDNVTNPSRMTIPAGVSKIKISCNVNWALNAAGRRTLSVRVNGNIRYQTIVAPALITNTEMWLHTPAIEVAENDYFQVEVFQDSGVALLISTGIGNRMFFGVEVVE